LQVEQKVGHGEGKIVPKMKCPIKLKPWPPKKNKDPLVGGGDKEGKRRKKKRGWGGRSVREGKENAKWGRRKEQGV